jgi:hypothetical protein
MVQPGRQHKTLLYLLHPLQTYTILYTLMDVLFNNNNVTVMRFLTVILTQAIIVMGHQQHLLQLHQLGWDIFMVNRGNNTKRYSNPAATTNIL